MSTPYSILILDPHCTVTMATTFKGNVVGAVAYAQRLASAQGHHGYEIWLHQRRVVSSYACDRPPARRAADGDDLGIHPAGRAGT